LIESRVLTLVYGDSVLSLCLSQARLLLDRMFDVRARLCNDAHPEASTHNRSNYLEIVALALINLCEWDVSVRATAYRLLCSVCVALNVPIAARLHVCLLQKHNYQFISLKSASGTSDHKEPCNGRNTFFSMCHTNFATTD
uniref:WAPL domain-containing protein n=1 Tax=Anisakis simplex TaxID=6269 RepID=A0A0M3J8S4_ANISI